jgi:hypothetical protein
MPNSTVRWIDRSQPQTLVTANVLLYINAVFGVIFLQIFAVPIGTILVVGQAAAGLGIANEKKWAYWLGVVLVGLAVALTVLSFSFANAVTLIFYVALFALLLHPQSRYYQRTYFRN